MIMETRKKIGVLFSILMISTFIPLIIFVSSLHGQSPKKTITLPNGEEVWDLNGEWNILVENIGKNAQYGNYPQIWKITQPDSSFVAVRMIDDPWNKKGSEAVRGELDKSGIKRVIVLVPSDPLGPRESKGQISDDGNRINISNDWGRLTATRK
jgi:hypothetical protein